MQATLEQLTAIAIFADLKATELAQLQPYTQVRRYQQGELVMSEGDRLPAMLYALAEGVLQIAKTATTGKETILRTLLAGKFFAAPALLGDGIAPATVTAKSDSWVLTLERSMLLEAIQHHPEIALRMMQVLNQRIQQLHETVHGLVSERAIVRLARFIQCSALQSGTIPSASGQQLKTKLPYYQIARSIGITYEECVRLFKSIHSIVIYQRGKLTILDEQALEAMALGTEALHAP
jgi:CRP-like cAMP-binding protein